MNATIPEQNKKKETKLLSRALYEAIDWIEVFLTALVTVILIFTFFFRIVVVSGSSMANTLQENDYLILSELGQPAENGDIVVLQINNYEEGRKPLIKRVIATGGQWVDIDFDTWKVYVGDTKETMEPIDEPYVLYQEGVRMRYAHTKDQYPMQVEEGHIFVLGDNRDGSLDSRDFSIGQVDENYIIGKAVFRLFPTTSFGTLN